MRKIVYMEWVKLKEKATFELGGSSVAQVHIDELPQARQAVDINDFNLYGYRPLINQIAARYQVDPAQVVTTQGCSMANYLACAAMVKPGDEVLIETPAYEPLLSVAGLTGAAITRFNRPYENAFQIDLDDFKKKLTPKTKLVMMTNLHNPSGSLTANDTLSAIGRLAAHHGAHVLVDEVYLDFLFDQRPPSSVHLGDNFIVTSSLTKAYGLDGLRCGWILTNPGLAKTIWRLQDFFGVNGAIPAEKISTVAFENLSQFEQRSSKAIEANRPIINEFMNAHMKELDWIPPDGGPVCFPRLKGNEDGWQFAERLFHTQSTRVIPGNFFEMPQHFRLGFGGPTEALKAGLDRISQALKT